MSQSKNIILIGPPNSGKTTLFNWLTGHKAHVMNYSGSTVDFLKGRLLGHYNLDTEAIDTPGVYSLFPKTSKTPSEDISSRILFENSSSIVIVTLDALRIHRQLPLALQLKEAGFQVIIALTMMDLIPVQNRPDIQALSHELGLTVCPIEGKLGRGVLELTEQVKQKMNSSFHTYASQKKLQEMLNLQDQFFVQTDYIVKKFFSLEVSKQQWTQRIDRILLHPVMGLLSFGAIMMTLFSSIFWLAAPLMDIMDSSFSLVADQIQASGSSLWLDFLSQGVVTSFAAVLVFVPQIFILFAGICILEDSGYLARAASLVDTLFSKIGLSGRSFIPFLAGYACAIPACLAARNIPSRWERWAVIAVIPLLTCSARLPVYALLLSLFFYGESPWKAGAFLGVIYIASMILAFLGVAIIHWMTPSQDQKSPFVMELPIYRLPLFLGVLFSAWRKTKSYVKGAGPLIFIFALVTWCALNFPRHESGIAKEQIENSYAGQFGKLIEPVAEQIGGDWRVGIGLLSAFVAREVFVSTLASLFQMTQQEDEDSFQHSLLKKMRKAKNKRGSPVFTPASVIALILFFMISLQCLSTTAIVQRETGSTIFALTQLVCLNVLAYVVSMIFYKTAHWLF